MMRALTLALLLLATPAAAQQRVTVVDGDTIRAGGRTIRIAGLDAPEMRGRCAEEIRLARAARARLAQLLEAGAQITPRGRARWGRPLAVVRDLAGRDVAAVLIAEGLARPYDGRSRRQGWCR